MNEFGKSDVKTTDIAPFSVRVSDDVKARLKQLQEESGATQPDFYRSLVALYIENKGMRDVKTQEEEDISGALSVISNSTIALINRLNDSKKAQKKSAERYNADLEELNRQVENMNEYTCSLVADLESVKTENEDLKKQLESVTANMQERMEKLNDKAAKEIEAVKNTMQKKINNLQVVADTIGELSEQAKYARQAVSKAEYELIQSTEAIDREKSNVVSLENSNSELKIRFESCYADNGRLQVEIDVLKENLSALSLHLSSETIAKNRAEAKLEILEPQLTALTREINSIRSSHTNVK